MISIYDYLRHYPANRYIKVILGILLDRMLMSSLCFAFGMEIVLLDSSSINIINLTFI